MAVDRRAFTTLLPTRKIHPPSPWQRSSAATGSNSLEIDQTVIAQQQQAYPDLQTIVSPLPLDEAYSLALQVATDLGWEIYHQDRNAGVIEAVDTTRIMAFKDDVVIRLRSNPQGVRCWTCARYRGSVKVI